MQTSVDGSAGCAQDHAVPGSSEQLMARHGPASMPAGTPPATGWMARPGVAMAATYTGSSKVKFAWVAFIREVQDGQ